MKRGKTDVNLTTATVSAAYRLRNSRDGNPRWAIETTDGAKWVTRRDSTVGFEISEAIVGETAKFALDGRGEVYEVQL